MGTVNQLASGAREERAAPGIPRAVAYDDRMARALQERPFELSSTARHYVNQDHPVMFVHHLTSLHRPPRERA